MRRYRAFISYSWADRASGEWLHRALESYRTPSALVGRQTPLGPVPKTLHPIFRDREEEAAGASIGASIETAMRESEFLIVLCSPRSAQSQWVNREVAWFKRNRDPRRILGVIVDGEPMASTMEGREGEECFPKTLRFKVGEDLSATDEAEDAPLAADARKTGDGKRGAKLKIAAALLGVGLGDLVMREDRRRAARRRLVYAGLSTLSVVLGGLSLFALEQRDAAVLARRDAEFQRDEAQSLVEFMLTDLRQRLDAVGRLDILEAVGMRLSASYAKQDLAKLDPDALGRRARVLMLLGEVDASRGDLDAALAQYKEAAATTEELLRRDPDNEQRIFDHAQSVYWVGDIAWKRGDVAQATDYWTQYRDFGARLVALDPDKDGWQTELGYGHRNLGVLAYNEGVAKDAVDAFTRACRVSKSLAKKHPEDSNLQIVYADDLIWLAQAEEKQGAFSNAESDLAAEAAISKSLLERDSANDAALQRQFVNRRITARLSIAQGDAKRALAILEDQVPIHKSRLAHDQDNTIWLDFFGLLQTDIAHAHLAAGNFEAARGAAEAAVSAGRRLSGIDPRVVEWKVVNFGGALQIAARAAATANDLASASRFVAEAEDLAGDSIDGADERLLMHIFAATNAAIRSHILEKSGDRAGAKRAAQTAITGHGRVFSRASPQYQQQFVRLYMLAEEFEKANALANELNALGYRHPDFMKAQTMLASRERDGGDHAAKKR